MSKQSKYIIIIPCAFCAFIFSALLLLDASNELISLFNGLFDLERNISSTTNSTPTHLPESVLEPQPVPLLTNGDCTRPIDAYFIMPNHPDPYYQPGKFNGAGIQIQSDTYRFLVFIWHSPTVTAIDQLGQWTAIGNTGFRVCIEDNANAWYRFERF